MTDLRTIHRDGNGTFGVRPVDPEGDAALLHTWFTHPKARFWLMGEATLADVITEYRRIAAHPDHHAYLGFTDGEPSFLMERYDPSRVELAGVPEIRAGDVGMHFLTAPTTQPRPGFTRSVITAVLTDLFADPAIRRVLVEPDIHNTAVQQLNAAVGFTPIRELRLPEKTALLSECPRAAFRPAGPPPTIKDFSMQQGKSVYPTDPGAAVAHLDPVTWAEANRMLLAKALGEYSHERLLEPEPIGADRYQLPTPDGSGCWRFTARRLPLRHWQVDPGSISHQRDGADQPLDLLRFVLDFGSRLGLDDQLLPVYLEELSATLSALAYKLSEPAPNSRELIHADFQQIEAAMLAGHPCFIANSGRIGWGVHEYRAFAPEAARGVRLLWLAARREVTTFSSCRDLSHDELLEAELGADERARFTAQLRELGLDPQDYLLLPVHPWQWWNKLAVTFAADVANRRLVVLGEGGDDYQAQQSVRTFFNRSDPGKHYVKTALSVINMGFMRGLSAAYMEATPAINDWLADLVAGDETLRGTGVRVIRERAAIGYHARQYAEASDKHSPYRKMLAALWRESPVPGLAPGRRLATMAALLHLDRDGGSFCAALIEQSGWAPTQWLRRYLEAYLVPLLHCFYRYGLVFMPHGENIILELDNGVVERVILKDLAEEIAVMSADTPLPSEIERVRVEVPEELQLLSIFTDVFDCFLRPLSAILAEQRLLEPVEFWAVVAAVAGDYQRSTPELAERFARFDLFTDEFALSCLNRLQLRNSQQMVDLADPASALQLVGSLANPLAGAAGSAQQQPAADSERDQQHRAEQPG